MFLDRVVHFGENLGERVNCRPTRKPKIVDRGSLCSEPESTGSKVQHEPYLFSVACSLTELSISGKIWRSGKVTFTEKATITDRGSLWSALESAGSKLQSEPYLFSVGSS